MGNGYLTESEVQFIKNKDATASKFKEVFDMYHEVVPREEVAKAEPDLVKDDGNNGVQTLDAEQKPEQKPEEKPEQKTEEQQS